VAGEIPRAPAGMQRLGLEWLYRMVQEPKRLCRRYLLDGIPFLAQLLSSAVAFRVRHAARGVR
jgi:N-acetylglucosaminyldiphosphoundecaprenol N-acetyl-beta-D-mannosaminyltransferase